MSEEIVKRKSLLLVIRRDMLRRNKIYRAIVVWATVLSGVILGAMSISVGVFGGPEAGSIWVAGFVFLLAVIYMYVNSYVYCSLGCKAPSETEEDVIKHCSKI